MRLSGLLGAKVRIEPILPNAAIRTNDRLACGVAYLSFGSV